MGQSERLFWEVKGSIICTQMDKGDLVVLPCYKEVAPKVQARKSTTADLPEHIPSHRVSKGSDGPLVMALRAHWANPDGGVATAFRGRVSLVDRRGRREKRLPSVPRTP